MCPCDQGKEKEKSGKQCFEREKETLQDMQPKKKKQRKRLW
jgi:hypothetical protein